MTYRTERKDMFISTRRGARLAAVVGLSAAVVVGMAAPAFASPGTNEAFGIRASGLVAAGPFSESAFPAGPSAHTFLSATVPGLLTSGTINTAAGESSASASVEDLAVTLTALASLTATAVSSECSYNPDTAVLSGSSSIADGAVSILGGAPITLSATPAPNTPVASIPGVASIILNRQVSGADGSLTVDAIYIELLNAQVIRISTSHCHPEVLVIPVIAPEFAAGAGVLGLLALGFVLYRRRQTAADAA